MREKKLGLIIDVSASDVLYSPYIYKWTNYKHMTKVSSDDKVVVNVVTNPI